MQKIEGSTKDKELRNQTEAEEIVSGSEEAHIVFFFFFEHFVAHIVEDDCNDIAKDFMTQRASLETLTISFFAFFSFFHTCFFKSLVFFFK